MLHGTKTGSCNASTMSDLTKNAMTEEIQQTAARRNNGNNASEEAKCFKTGRMIGCISSSVTSASLSNGWLGFRPTPTSEEVQADIALLRNRNYLDPKSFYKSSDVQSGKRRSIVQVGTVIEGAAEFYSSRLTKKEKRRNVTDEVLADTSLSGYVQNKYRSMQQQKTAANKKAKRRNNTGRSRK
jgi:Fcf2 pre-rRNA processing